MQNINNVVGFWVGVEGFCSVWGQHQKHADRAKVLAAPFMLNTRDRQHSHCHLWPSEVHLASGILSGMATE